MCVEPEWQRFMMKTFLFPPALKGLFPEYLSTIYAAAPALRGKNLEVYVESVNLPVFTGTDFKYANDQAYALMGPYLKPGGKIAGGMSVQAAFTEMAQLVTNFEQAQARLAAPTG